MRKLGKETILVFISICFLYFSTAAGYLDTIDADASIETAKSLIDSHRLSVTPARPDRMIYGKGSDGKWVTKMGLGTPLIYIPFILLARVHQRLSHENEKLTTDFYISMVNPFLTALIISLLFFFFRCQGYSLLFTLWLSVATAFGTLLFPYSKSAHREPLQALCLLAAFAFPLLSKKLNHSSWLFLLGGCAAGFGILSKQALVLPLTPVFILICFLTRRTRNLFSFFIPVIFSLLTMLAFSQFAFGSMGSAGYTQDVTLWNGRAWATPFWVGVWKQTLSSDTGFIFFNPFCILIFCVVLWKVRVGLWTWLDTSISLSIAFQLFLYARWWSPTGNEALGPRYMVSIVPLLSLLFWNLPQRTIMFPYLRIFLIPFTILCISLQGIHVSIKPQQHWALKQYSQMGNFPPQWKTNLKLFLHKWNGMPERYSMLEFADSDLEVDLSSVPSFEGFNYWWAHWCRYREKGHFANVPRAFPRIAGHY